MPRTHDRNEFYKFATVETAKVVIERRSLRWRTPLQFNDPFDTQTRLTAAVDPDEFADRFVSRVAELAFSAPRPAYFDGANKLHVMATVMGRITDEAKKKEALAVLRNSALETARTMSQSLGEFSKEVAAHMQHGRTFCMTEDINNVVMWSHYAEEHRGVGFKLRVLEDIDHPFLIAKPVEYSDEYVKVGNAIELADHFTKAHPIDLVELCWKLVYLKHIDWKYEREWRCYWPLLREPPGTGYSDYVQDPRLFEAIYLGCCMPDATAEEVIDLTRRHLPATRIFRGKKSETTFDLEFVEV